MESAQEATHIVAHYADERNNAIIIQQTKKGNKECSAPAGVKSPVCCGIWFATSKFDLFPTIADIGQQWLR